VRVEVWSDIVCPWCAIGFQRLHAALADFPHRDEVQVQHRSYQLYPHAPAGTWPLIEQTMGNYRISAEQAQANFDRIQQVAAAEGLEMFRLRDNVIGNTGSAHELLAYATARGIGERAWAHLYRAYFVEARSLFDLESLVGLADELELETDVVRRQLEQRRYEFTVANDDQELRSRGVAGVPYFVFAGRYLIAGAESVETMRQGLESGWQHSVATEGSTSG
jgi:predicted DsbA family dithiol-disulfide isomerase